MNTDAITLPENKNWSFFSMAAWYSLVVPFLALAAMLLIFNLEGRVWFIPPASRQLSGAVYGWLLLTNVSSFLLGVVSLFGIRKHTMASILWRAIPGIIVSCFFGFFCFAMGMASGINC